MFAQAHVFFTRELSKRKDPTYLFASIFPDIAWTSLGKIDRDDVHPRTTDNLNVDPHFNIIVEGLKYHIALDHYAHDFEGGYAFNNAKVIEPEVANLLGIENGLDSLVMAHNFIESAVDLCLVDKFPDLVDLYKEVITSPDADLFADYSEKYLGVSKKDAQLIIDQYRENLKPSNMSTFEGQSEIVLPLLISLKFTKDVDLKECRKILREAIEIVSPTFLDFMNNSISQEGKEK